MNIWNIRYDEAAKYYVLAVDPGNLKDQQKWVKRMAWYDRELAAEGE